jgi:hypothetical protein
VTTISPRRIGNHIDVGCSTIRPLTTVSILTPYRPTGRDDQERGTVATKKAAPRSAAKKAAPKAAPKAAARKTGGTKKK